VLKNQDIINEAEKILQNFKPVTYDASAQLKAIDAFESKAVSVEFFANVFSLLRIFSSLLNTRYYLIGCSSAGHRWQN